MKVIKILIITFAIIFPTRNTSFNDETFLFAKAIHQLFNPPNIYQVRSFTCLYSINNARSAVANAAQRATHLRSFF